MSRSFRNLRQWLRQAVAYVLLGCPVLALAYEQRGQVTFNGLPVPGATITASQGTKKFTAVSDPNGYYRFANLPDGSWRISVSLFGFSPQEQSVTVDANQPGIRWELKMLPLDQVLAQTKIIKAPTVVAPAPSAETSAKTEGSKPAAEAPRPSSEAAQANDGFLVNGPKPGVTTSQSGGIPK